MEESASTPVPPPHVPRRAVALRSTGTETRLLVEWRALDAYVLLGDPGAGKSQAFVVEAAACNGEFTTARDFIAGLHQHTKGRTLFIDGLDEVRAGSRDGRAPFDAIRVRLNDLGRPRFRLSCREADWLGHNDAEALRRASPDGNVEVLHLEPLSHDDVFALLRQRSAEVLDPEGFWSRAETVGLTAMFGNPLLLDLTVRAVAASGWRGSRQQIYEQACRQLAEETSPEHRAAAPLAPGDIDRLLDDAGLLFAVLLLSGRRAITQGKVDTNGDLVPLSTLPAALGLSDAAAALRSKVFGTQAGESAPRHRSIAEYLGARALAQRIRSGVPLGRVLALMQGFDGRPVEPLRGLFAWLVVQHAGDRERLLRLDPLGVVLNGDAAALATSEKLLLLGALRDEARRDPWFRTDAWVSHPFGALATEDMTRCYDELLLDPSRESDHQSFMDCVFDALRHGQPMPPLAQGLKVWVEDGRARIDNRIAAYEAWKHCAGFDARQAREWLDKLHAGTLEDSDDRLTGVLLTDLYPEFVGPREVFDFLRPRSRRDLIAEYSLFWSSTLLRRSRPHDFQALADAWLENKLPPESPKHDFDMRRLGSKVLAAALEHAGDDVTTERLHAWLGIGSDQYGFSNLDEEAKAVTRWLTDRPERIKSVVALGYRLVQPDKNGVRHFWECEQRLHGAELPRDWLKWLLEQATCAPNEDLARYCFANVAQAVIDPRPGFDAPTMEHIEQWVDTQVARWPQARQWLEQAWSSPIDDWRGDQVRRQRKHDAKELASREERRIALQPHLAAIAEGTAPVHLMHQVALAHEKGFSDIRGETPLQRVQDLLVSDVTTAESAVAGLRRVLARSDLPTVDEILSLESKGKYHLIRPAALLAAQSVHARTPETPLSWSEDLVQRMVAFYLTDGTGDMPDWYKVLAKHRPASVAPILIRYAGPKLRRRGTTWITGLWALSQGDGLADLARLVLPTLLDRMAPRASEAGRRELNRSLLAALPLLDGETAVTIIRRKLEIPSLDAAQRIAWLVADLPYRADAAERLASWIGANQRRAVALGNALHEQDSLARTVHRLHPAAVGRMIEVLTPITKRRAIRTGAYWATAVDERERIVSALISILSSNPSQEAREELARLQALPTIGAWFDAIRYGQRTQQATAREAHFKHPDPASAALALAGGAPANGADLMALTLEHLHDIEAHLRGNNTYLLRQFWGLGAKLPVPLNENDCRDLLQEKLLVRLKPLGVNVEREGSAADDKRADMRVEFSVPGERFAVPIEVKKEDHPKLWTAWRDQLHRLYSNDPDAGGLGIYLVLWFGVRPRASPEGIKPRDAAHLQELIAALVPLEERGRIAVLVMDLSISLT